MIVAIVLCITFLKVAHISYTHYSYGGRILEFFLTPTIICFAYYINKEWAQIKSNLVGIIISVIVGLIIAMASTYYVSGFAHLGHLRSSMLPLNAYLNTAALEAKKIGGHGYYASFFVMVNALIGYGIAPFALKTFGITNPIARGIALGTSMNVLGASKALEIGESETAVASISFVLGAIFMVYLIPYALALFRYINHLL
jgi:holin-like protein LrgB